MEIFIAEQCKTLAESSIMGLIFGAGYDIIRILHVLCGIASYSGTVTPRKTGRAAFLVFLAGDLLYMLTVTGFASVFLYHTNHGQFRLYLALGCICGFCLYHYTAGRLVMHISEAVVRFIKWIVYHTVIRPVRWLIRLWLCAVRFGIRLTFGNIRRGMEYWMLTMRMRRRMKHFPELVRFQP